MQGGYDSDLRRWANQGVLLINTAQTCEVNKIGSHYAIWKPFTEYIFESINKIDKDIIFILMGRKAESWQLVIPGQRILKCPHPAAAAALRRERRCLRRGAGAVARAVAALHTHHFPCEGHGAGADHQPDEAAHDDVLALQLRPAAPQADGVQVSTGCAWDEGG